MFPTPSLAQWKLSLMTKGQGVTEASGDHPLGQGPCCLLQLTVGQDTHFEKDKLATGVLPGGSLGALSIFLSQQSCVSFFPFVQLHENKAFWNLFKENHQL